ncbi:MAG TPA: glycosyltransferase [Acidimicrobiia bacterium]|nr:glycosyltransferase [Acidimicrobiia bacterium]
MRGVMLVTPTAAPGGAERALAALARRLPDDGWRCVAVSIGDGPAVEWLRDAGAAVEVVPETRLRDVPRSLALVTRLRSSIRRHGVDVVVGNQARGHLYAGLAAATARLPAIWWNHVIPEPDWLNRVASRIPSAAIVCSTSEAVAAQRAISPRRRIERIPPGIDVAAVAARRGSGAAVATQLRRATTSAVVGIVGRLQAWKGQDVFLHAAARIAARHPGVRFAVVGGAVLGWEGDERGRLETLARDLGIADRVHFTGHVDDPYPWLDALDVVVNASVTPEPFGLAVLEAMALARPVVATFGGGPSEIVENGTSGILVPPGDAAALADAVIALLADAERADAIGRAAARRAEAFDEARTAEAFAALFDDVTGSARG